jgi:hypothetical protein
MRNLFVFLLLSMQYAQAQQTLLINSYGTYNSTGVRRQVTDAFFYGGLIDSTQINRSLANLSQRNSFGLQMALNAQWQSPWMVSKDQKKWGSSYRWVFGAGVHQYAGLQFSKDLFGLVFQGGLPYAGDTLDLSNLRAQATTFSKLGFGLYNPTTQSSFLLHFVAVQQHLGATIQKGAWFQDPSSAQINLELIGQANLSSFSSNTYGLAIDIDYRFGASDSSANEPQFQLSIQNLGFARSFEASAYSLDGSLAYSGYTLSEWQQTNLQALASAYLDSLGFEQTSGPSWILLPAQIQLAKTLDWNSPQRLEAYYGAQFMLRQTYTPLVYVGAQLKVNQAWHTGIGMAYGGFGGLRMQAYSAFRFKRSELLLRSDNIALQNGASIYLQYRCDF